MNREIKNLFNDLDQFNDNIDDIILSSSNNISIKGQFSYNYDIISLNENILSRLDKPKKKEYYNQTKSIIKKYCKINNLLKNISLNENETDSSEFDNLDQETKILVRNRISLIKSFILICENFVDIDIKFSGNINDLVCIDCQYSFDQNKILDKDNLICDHCGAENLFSLNYTNDFISKDSGNNLQNNLENFIKTLDRYQGIQLEIIPKELFIELEKYFLNINIDCEKIRKSDYNYRGRKKNTSHVLIYDALFKIKKQQYYQDVNYICHILWGWKLPDISNLKDIIIKHFIETQRAYLNIPNEIRGRYSTLGNQYRLWRHLQLVNYDCHFSDFKITENTVSLENHHRLWKEMCDRCEDSDIYYIED